MSKLNKFEKIHFIGIGGISLSSLAKMMIMFGKKITGSDITYSEELVTLSQWGAKIWVGSNIAEIAEADLIVFSSAVGKGDAELIYGKENNIPVMERHVFLAYVADLFDETIAVSGTHGKTTVTGMIASIFKYANLLFTAHIGGYVSGGIENMVFKGKQYFLTEACEYKKSFLSLSPQIAVVLNVEQDHPDTYSTIDELYEAFYTFIKSALSSGGCAIINANSNFFPSEFKGAERIITIGDELSFNYSARNIEEYMNGRFRFQIYENGNPESTIDLKIFGYHNIYNSLFAIAVARQVGLNFDVIKYGIQNYMGVKRRFEYKGKLNGADIIIDYAHHPSEIKSTINTALSLKGKRLFVVFQPHTFSRTKQLLTDFVISFIGADELFIFKTYSARELESDGLSAYDLYQEVKGQQSVKYFDILLPLAKQLIQLANEGDIILILGAGDIDNLYKLLV